MNMKKIMGTILLVGICLNTPVYANDIAIRTPVIAMQTSTKNANAEAKLKSQAPKYKNDTLRVYLDFVNNTKNSIQLASEFRLEYSKNGKWEKVPVADLKDSYGKLDATAFQFPVKPGETNEFGAYIGGYIPRDKASKEDNNLTQLPVGKYRVVIKDDKGKEYTAEFELVAEDVFADSTRLEMKMDRPIYDGNVEKIRYTIFNRTDKDLGYGVDYQLEKFENGKWAEYPIAERKDQKRFTSIGANLMANSSGLEWEMMDWYAKPFQPGKYRLIKPIGTEKVKAEFEISDIKKAMTLPEPREVELTYKGTNKTVKINYTEKDKEYLSNVVHELLAFQENKKSDPLNDNDGVIQVVVEDKKGKSVTVDLFQEKSTTSALVGGKVYTIADPNVIPRICKDSSAYGISIPYTGETIIQALKEKDVFQNVKFKQHDFSIPFKKSGWLSNREESNVNLSIFSYDRPTEVLSQSHKIFNNGYTIETQAKTGELISSVAEKYDWEQPPHYYTAGKCLVMYCGTDQKALTALKEIFGDEVDTTD